MSLWTEKRAEIQAALKNTSTKSHSKGDLVELTQALLNSPEEELSVYVKDENTEAGYAEVKCNPSKDFRNQMKRMVVDTFGIDKADAAKLDAAEFSKGMAEAIDTVALHTIKAYMEDGRKLVFPVTSPSDARMGVSIDKKPERKSESIKFIDKEDGTVEKVSTGKYVVTKEHYAVNSHNKVPDWLKSHE